MAMKKSVWDMILKVVIAVASAVAGVLGANAMSLLEKEPDFFRFILFTKVKKRMPASFAFHIKQLKK